MSISEKSGGRAKEFLEQFEAEELQKQEAKMMVSLVMMFSTVVAAKALTGAEIEKVCEFWKKSVLDAIPEDEDTKFQDEFYKETKASLDKIANEFIEGGDNLSKMG